MNQIIDLFDPNFKDEFDYTEYYICGFEYYLEVMWRRFVSDFL